MTEYALLVALISLLVIGAVRFLGLEAKEEFDKVAAALENNPTSAGCTDSHGIGQCSGGSGSSGGSSGSSGGSGSTGGGGSTGGSSGGNGNNNI